MSRTAHRVKTSINAVQVAGTYAVYQRRLVTQESRSLQRRILPLSEQDTPGLLQDLARVPDPRDAGGRIHPLPGLLAIAAVVSRIEPRRGDRRMCRRPAGAAWERLGATRDAFTGVRRVPDDSTLSRVLTGIDADALDAAVCRWLLSRRGLTGAGRRVIAVDGRTLRGSGPTGPRCTCWPH
ncbi:transposase family protein [Micromonospora saelicesensis]|uniref:transposase family protein n=1 Tax=Micromonospora saelicesensis TaxID=285676 RepID=UPI003CF3D7BE